MSGNFFARAWNSVRRRMGGKLTSFRKSVSRIRYGKNIYLVYTMGKVGTTTISQFFKKEHPELISFHLHYLSDFWLKEKLPSLHPIYHVQIKDAQEALDTMAKFPNLRLKIFTMVREPIDREISIIFQNWQGLFNVNSINELSEEEVVHYLNEHTDENALSWFDTEFKAFLDFDIYALPFDKEKGYTIYHREHADILCMTTEKLNSCLQRAMKEFTGMNITGLSSANKTEDREGKELYKLLKKNYTAPVEKLKLLYNSKHIGHFYSEKEIEVFVKKWSHGETNYSDIKNAV